MSDRLHEIIGQIGILHNSLIENKKINNADEVFEVLKSYPKDVENHYLNLLLQYYFQNNDLSNLKKVLLVGAKFDMRFEDIKEAFLNIKSGDENVIEFMEENIVYLKDNDLDKHLQEIFKYYNKNSSFQKYLEKSITLIKRNRYVCAYCFKNSQKEYAIFFLNEDLLESLQRDLPYLLN